VENIRAIGLKKPITVTERDGADGSPAYLLVCGEGRLNAFRLLGETHIVITHPLVIGVNP
jgi:ParB family chromosome partitioning protein